MVMVPLVAGCSLGCRSTLDLAWLIQRSSVPTFPAGKRRSWNTLGLARVFQRANIISQQQNPPLIHCIPVYISGRKKSKKDY